jgi:hypothetical protein
MSIGKWIVASFVLFAAFIATLVVVCVRQDISLVSKDYYQEELQYQEHISQENNTAALTEKPTINVADHAIEVRYADMQAIENGKLTLFCPSNEKMDRFFKFHNAQEMTTSFATDGLQKGLYRARLQWTMNGKNYFHEEVIYL